MKTTNRILSMLLAAVMIFGILPVTAFAEDQTYLAIGDSISTGAALADPTTEAFPVLVQAALEADGHTYTLVNKAQNGETTTSLLTKLADEDYKAAVKAADIITLTIGGNDLMDILYNFLATKMNKTVDEVKTMLADGTDIDALTVAAECINDETNGFTVTTEQLNAIAKNVTSVISAIKALNSEAVLVVATQYNPYKYLNGQITAYSSLLNGSDYEPLANAVVNLTGAIEAGLTSLNGAIKAGTGYSVADAYTAFENSEALLCNAQFIMLPSVSVSMDFHPNATGHVKIAELMTAAIEDNLKSAHTHDYTAGYVDNGDGTHSAKCECDVADESTKAEHGNWTADGTAAGKHKCGTCGYEEAHSLTETDKKDATCTEGGNSAYWTCSGCGKHFSDESGTTEIKENDWIIDATGHSWTTEGADEGEHKCEVCTQQENHRYTDDSDRSCEDCQYERAIYYTVSFNANGGTGTMNSANYDPAGGTFTLPQCTFTPPAGKIFAGWSIPEREGVFASGDEVEFPGDIELTAVWKDAPVVEEKDPCKHEFDKEGICKHCKIQVINHTKPENETNPNTGAPAPLAAIAAAVLLGAVCLGKNK